MNAYVRYALTLLEDTKTTEIVMKGTGTATSRVVQLTEIIKRRVSGLYQVN